MKIENFESDLSSISYEIFESTIPVTYIVNYLEKNKNFAGKPEISVEENIKIVRYKDAIITINEDSFEIPLLHLSEYNISVAVDKASSKDAKMICDTILSQIPKPIYNKLKIKEYYRTTVRVKTNFRISNLIKDDYIDKFNEIKKTFPKFEKTERDLQIPGLHLRITPVIKGDYASRVVKGLEPMVSYALDFHFASSTDYENNILTVTADLEDTKIKQILQQI